MGELFAVFGRDDFLSQLLVHVELSVVALLIGVAIAMPIALATFRSPSLSYLLSGYLPGPAHWLMRKITNSAGRTTATPISHTTWPRSRTSGGLVLASQRT